MKRILVSLFIIMFMIIMNGSYANGSTSANNLNTNSVGIIHKDGSYQFSKSELQKLNDYIAMHKDSKKTITIAEILSYVVPQRFDMLSDDAKTSMSTQSIQTSMSTQSVHLYWEATISKYGSSLKGTATIGRVYRFV